MEQLRAHPLLTPPGESWWAAASERDLMLMGRWHRGYRPQHWSNIPHELAETLFHMRELGSNDRPTPLDRARMRRSLQNIRKSGDGYNLAAMIYHMNAIGVGCRLTDDDYDAILKYHHELMKSLPIEIMDSHTYLRRLGRPQEITERERKAMLSRFNHIRQEKRGRDIAFCHHFLSELGIPQQVTDGDIREMRETVERYRKEGDAPELAATLYHLKTIIPYNAEAAGRQPLPPLKEFQKK